MGRNMGSTNAPAAERFWRFVTRLSVNECWLWKGGMSGTGYGAFMHEPHKQTGAHRFSWALHFNGAALPPKGLVVAHVCDVRACVNPAHLILSTQKANIRDMVLKGRQKTHNGAKTHCLRGHEYTPQNTWAHGGKRGCKQCGNLRRRKSFLAEHFKGRERREQNIWDSLRSGV